jgi:arylformamidase
VNSIPGIFKPTACDESVRSALRVIDLTLTLRDGMRGVTLEPSKTVERDGWNATTLHLYSHAGTHMDAQIHFDAGPETIDQHAIERCIGPAWVVRCGDVQPRQLLDVATLGEVCSVLQPGDSLLLRTDWSRHVNDPGLYRDALPRISDALAHWCVDHGVKMLGVEPPSVADVNDKQELTRIHRILLTGGVIIVEGLTNLASIRRDKVQFAALPLKIQGGDGAPVRAFALEEASAGGLS